VIETVPMVLNTASATAGFVYPYPDVFEPVMLESQDGTPVCGLLAMQPDRSQRPALITVHGLFTSKNTRSMLDLALRAYYVWGFHVFALDLRNFGDSSRFSEAPTSWGYRESDDVLAAAEYLETIDEVSTVAACGASMGAASTLVAAARSRLDGPLSGGVVAVNGYADARGAVEHISGAGGGSLVRILTGLTFRLLLVIKTSLGGPRRFADFREYTRELAGQYYEVSDEDIYRKASPVRTIREIEVPCLIIHAEDDQVVRVSEAEELVRAAANNPMVGAIIVPTGGHVLYPVMSRTWFYETLRVFFTYWGEFGVDVGVSEVIDTLDMFGNPDN